MSHLSGQASCILKKAEEFSKKLYTFLSPNPGLLLACVCFCPNDKMALPLCCGVGIGTPPSILHQGQCQRNTGRAVRKCAPARNCKSLWCTKYTVYLAALTEPFTIFQTWNLF